MCMHLDMLSTEFSRTMMQSPPPPRLYVQEFSNGWPTTRLSSVVLSYCPGLWLWHAVLAYCLQQPCSYDFFWQWTLFCDCRAFSTGFSYSEFRKETELGLLSCHLFCKLLFYDFTIDVCFCNLISSFSNWFSSERDPSLCSYSWFGVAKYSK